MKRIAISLALVTTTTSAHADSDWMLYTGIGALGAGAVALGLTYYEGSRVRAAQDDPDFDTYRRRFKGSVDVCEQARAGNEGTTSSTDAKLAPAVADLCDSTSKHQTLEYVFLGTGVVLVTTGVVLLAARPKHDEKTTVSITPTIGPRVSAVTLTVRF